MRHRRRRLQKAKPINYTICPVCGKRAINGWSICLNCGPRERFLREIKQ